MGKRLFNYTLTHPHNNVILLNKIYDITDFCVHKMELVDFNDIIASLIGMYDIEKIIRKIYINRLSYTDISKLYHSLREIKTIMNIINKRKYKNVRDYINYICNDSLDKMKVLTDNELYCFDKYFTSDFLMSKNENNENIINLGVYKEHDNKVIEYYKTLYSVRILYHYFNDLIKKAEQCKSKSNKVKSYKREPLKINTTERGTLTFELTSSRATTLTEYMMRETNSKKNIRCIADGINSEYHKKVINENLIPSYLLDNDTFVEQCFEPIYLEGDIEFDKASSKGQKIIVNDTISNILKTTQITKESLESSVKEHFNIFLTTFKKNLDDYHLLVKLCSQIDLLTCYVTVAKISNYCKPDICEENDYSFCSFKGLRHPLIELLLENELYIANSITLENNDSGNDKYKDKEPKGKNKNSFNNGQGFLLYGTNTVGKSSFIKSIGIGVIMAQCGFYVAAEKMKFKPYKSIYTRILGNDDLFRGLSTFNVEMIELKNILNYADENTLILGDEVCSGTEMGSASSIFMGALEHLYYTKSKFIFATHFHNIVDCEEMKALTNMKNIHLSVRYDKEKDKLLYDRKLKEGAGENMYGLEVCKYLHLPDDFIKRSYELRNKYFNQNTSLLDLKQSKYNSKKLVGDCEQCGMKGTEVHHLQFQRNSDEKGFIKNKSLHHYFHKNKKANLMVLCDKCHDNLHSESDTGHYRISNELEEFNE